MSTRVTKRRSCLNPNCKSHAKGRSLYCSDHCRTIVLSLKRGVIISKSQELDVYQAGTLELPNGMEVRNDAMGKEITGRVS